MEYEHESTTAQLITLAQRGGPAGELAWNALVERYWEVVVRRCGGRLGADLAADAAQETWFRVFRAVDRFRVQPDDPEGVKFKNWVLVIAESVCVDAIRARNRRPKEEPLERDGAPSPRLLDHGPSPPEQALAMEQREQILAALNSLSDVQRGVALLRCKELSHAEIAETLGIPIGTVKSRVSAAFGHLRNVLKEYVYEPQPRD